MLEVERLQHVRHGVVIFGSSNYGQDCCGSHGSEGCSVVISADDLQNLA